MQQQYCGNKQTLRSPSFIHWAKEFHKNRPSPWHVQLLLLHKSTLLLSGRLPPAGLVTAGPYSAMYRAALWWHREVFSWPLKPTAKIVLMNMMRNRVFHHFLFPREAGEDLSVCPWVLSISEDQTHHDKTGYQVAAYCLCRGSEQSLALHKRAKRQPAGNLNLYSSANIYGKRSSFSILSRIRCSVKSSMGFYKARQKTLVTNGMVNM